MMRAFAILCLAGACAIGVSQQPTPPDVRPTTRVRDCTTSGCHAPTIDYQVLHGPTVVGACDMCHQHDDPAQHTFTLKRDGAELCAFCHIDKIAPTGPSVHEPFAKGDCTACHNPHGGHDRRLLNVASMTSLCLNCHEDTIRGTHLHTPAAQDDCTACHNPHSGQHKGMLPLPGRQLCLSCHDLETMRMTGTTHIHEPAQEDCLACHDNHASDFENHLVSSARELCTSCHQEVGDRAAAAPFQHGAMTDDLACLNCHQPHASTLGALMRDGPDGACLQCHAEDVTRPDGTVVKSVAHSAQPGFHLHGPVRDGQCNGCHEPHGADHAGLLTAHYTKAFYEPFSNAPYALCFKCHDPGLAREPKTTTATFFRDGDRNLHFLHVNMDERGRTCRSCHEPHATRAPSLIAESVQYGEWQLPITLKRTETGATCASGCHKPESYERGPLPPDFATRIANSPTTTQPPETQPPEPPPSAPPSDTPDSAPPDRPRESP